MPRQPGLVDAVARLELFPPFDRAEVFSGLEGFSHVWISFVFHLCLGQQARLTVRPPRLGGNRKIGVFASRSTHRPNPIGISVVALAGIEQFNNGISLLLKGADVVDGTPVLDIKPYIPYTDAIPSAVADYAQATPVRKFEVRFSLPAEQQCRQQAARWPDLRQLIISVLSLDPRPAYLPDIDFNRRYAIRLYDLDVHWHVLDPGLIEVLAVESLTGG